MKIYDSYSQELREFTPYEGNKVKMYVCGPTVYDLPHLGHARCYITWDMVVRYLRFKGYNVTYVRNITDVDDKIINKARETGTTPEEVAKKYYEEFKKEMQELNVADPDIEPKATQNIQEMINIIQRLIDKGFAYESDGDVYFSVNKFKRYGRLSKQNIKDLEAGARVEASEKKQDPLDFALWKAVKNPDEISWNSPWGKGRPGWHIECSAMSEKYLGIPIDIHAGGQDLLFPHHENEMAQSEAAFSGEFVRYWMHNGFVIINSEKMSKSLGNFITINDILDRYDANTIRFFILTNHYRMPVEFNDEGLKSARAGVKRLKNAVEDVINTLSEEKIQKAQEILNILIDEIAKTGNLPFHKIDEIHYIEENIPADLMEKIIKELKIFINGMDDDFNTSVALSSLFEIAGCAQKERESGHPENSAYYIALLLRLSDVLGFQLRKQEKPGDILASQLMDIILSVRSVARTQKNWEISDKIRDELKKINVTIKDHKDGSSSWSFGD